MRVMVIILSSFAALIIAEQTAVPIRLSLVVARVVPPPEATAAVALFSAWVLATALVYRFPGVAVLAFALAGAIGLVGGTAIDQDHVVWGGVALVLAVLTLVARAEKRAADRVARRREQHELAVHLALRSLQETVPALLAREPAVEPGEGA